MRNFTVFAPSNDAIINAFKSGAFNYPYLYTNNLTTLEGIVAYHVVPQYQFAGPSKQTLNMKTLLTEVRSSSPGVQCCTVPWVQQAAAVRAHSSCSRSARPATIAGHW